MDDVAVWPGGAVVIDVLGNDYDGNGDSLAITAFSPGAAGTVTHTDDLEALLYTPANGTAGTDQFTYSISDGQFSRSATVFLVRAGAPPPPPTPPPAQARFQYSCDGLSCTFTAEWSGINDAPRYYHWNWGDGTTTPPQYSGRTAQHNFTPGSHSVTLVITFVTGVQVSSGVLPITVQAPAITCSFDPAPTGLQLVTRLRQLSNYQQPGFDAYDYYWDFGDGTGWHQVSHVSVFDVQIVTYRLPDIRTINFIVTPRGQTTILGQCPRVMDIANAPPLPAFDAVQGDGVTRSRKLYRFIPSTWDEWPSEVNQWEWNFGDGTFAEYTGTSHFDHLFSRPGNYTVTLKVTDSLGATRTVVKTLNAPNEPPTARLKFQCIGRMCTFDASQSTDDGDIRTYNWNFGDGTREQQLEDSTISHTFAADLPYDVTLTVSDGAEQNVAMSQVTPRASALAEDLLFYALQPCRLLDTRTSGAALDSGSMTHIPITGRCGIPADARAVAANIAVLSPGSAGYLQVFAKGTSPGDTSTITFTPERSPLSNNTIVAIGAGSAPSAEGAISALPNLIKHGTVHMIMDVTGYFTSSMSGAASARGPLRFGRWGPWRAYDSRTAPGASPLTAGAPRTFLLRQAGACCPLDAEAHVVVVTAVNPSGGGHMVVYPTDIATPATATVNVQIGLARSNGALSALGRRDNDDLAVFYGAQAGSITHLTVDTYGWFARDADHRYYAIAPCRAVDTRLAQFHGPRIASGRLRYFQIPGNCGVPPGAKYGVVTATIIKPDGAGSARITASYDQSITNIQFAGGEDVANTIVAGFGDTDIETWITMAGGGGADLVLDVLGYFLPEQNQLPVATPDSATATAGAAVTIQVLANDTDGNGDRLKLSPRGVFNPPAGGTAVRSSDTSITYTGRITGTDRFQYEVVDTRGGRSLGTVTVEVRGTLGSATATEPK
jgi:PKD repeat protein